MSRRIIAQYVVDGMALSTANIYFTAHDDDGARVFRTAQSATPGEEIELCHEPDCRFGDIVYANVDDVFYGYFFVLANATTTVNGTTISSSSTTIRRIQLDQPGQVPEIIGPNPLGTDIDIVSSHGNLVTDGSFLYWQSDTAINKMHVQGGKVYNLDRTLLTRPVTGLNLDGPNLIYTVDRTVYYVPKGGTTTVPSLRVVFTADAGIVACATAPGDVIVVADRNGGIVSHSPNSTSVVQVPGTAFITSMAGAPGWTQMAADQIAPGQIEATWQLRLNAPGNIYTFTTGANPRLAMFNDTGYVYLVDDDGVVTYDQSVI